MRALRARLNNSDEDGPDLYLPFHLMVDLQYNGMDTVHLYKWIQDGREKLAHDDEYQQR